jgi:hypothetical protein
VDSMGWIIGNSICLEVRFHFISMEIGKSIKTKPWDCRRIAEFYYSILKWEQSVGRMFYSPRWVLFIPVQIRPIV